MKTFLFYDLETSGLNPVFDQVLTFACIRTDLNLDEIERKSLTLCLRKDIVPSPRAFLTHGLTFAQLMRGVTEYDAALELHRIFNTKDTIGLGYNSLGFDDDFLRFMFYRNLLDPYQHQYANGCSRADILPVTVIYRVFHPDCLKWPRMDGKPSLKLDLISRENRFVTSGRAHEAMSDVEALVQLSRIYFQNLKTWNYCLDFFDKTRDDDRIRNIPAAITIQKRPFRCCILASSAFGPAVNYMAPVIHIGQSRAYRNQSLWLRLDTDEISRIISDTDPTETFVIRKRSGDGLIVLPGLDRFWKRMAEKSQQSAVENLEMLTAHPEKFFAYIEYHTSYTYPVIPDLDPDAGLYQEGFFSQPEKIFIADFHAATVHQKPEILARAPGTRMQTLASRILARNFPDMISPKIQMPHQRYMERLRSADEKDRILGYRNDTKRTQNHALQELSELEQTMVNPDPAQKELLKGLRHYIETL